MIIIFILISVHFQVVTKVIVKYIFGLIFFLLIAHEFSSQLISYNFNLPSFAILTSFLFLTFTQAFLFAIIYYNVWYEIIKLTNKASVLNCENNHL